MSSAKSRDNLVAKALEKAGEGKFSETKPQATALSPQQSVTAPASDHPPEPSARPSNAGPVSGGNGPITSLEAAPVGQGLERQPAYKETPTPQYPALARQMGYQGTVELKLLVNRDGVVEELQIEKSSGYQILDQSAMAAVQRWRFKPGTRNGTEVNMWIKIPLSFKLH